MKVIVRRNWADASKAWIDVQTYTGLKLPPAGMQYKLSFMDKDSIPAQMIVTSDGVSWVDGLGGGYKGKTVLDMTIEEPQRGSESGGSGSGVLYDDVEFQNVQVSNGNDTTLTLLLNGAPLTSGEVVIHYFSTLGADDPLFPNRAQIYVFDVEDDIVIHTGFGSGIEYTLYVFLPTGAVKSIGLEDPVGGGGGEPG